MKYLHFTLLFMRTLSRVTPCFRLSSHFAMGAEMFNVKWSSSHFSIERVICWYCCCYPAVLNAPLTSTSYPMALSLMERIWLLLREALMKLLTRIYKCNLNTKQWRSITGLMIFYSNQFIFVCFSTVYDSYNARVHLLISDL